MEIDVESFKNKIVELWTKSVDEELEYSGLVKYCDKFFDTGYGILSRDRKKTKHQRVIILSLFVFLVNI